MKVIIEDAVTGMRNICNIEISKVEPEKVGYDEYRANIKGVFESLNYAFRHAKPVKDERV